MDERGGRNRNKGPTAECSRRHSRGYEEPRVFGAQREWGLARQAAVGSAEGPVGSVREFYTDFQSPVEPLSVCKEEWNIVSFARGRIAVAAPVRRDRRETE